ncbi:YigZ family protein [Flavobacteriales bacterium]|nr:YigZ family protein [Flavobacteriales bacterium]
MQDNLDLYKTIKCPSEGLYKEKGSKFIGYAFPLKSEDEIKERIGELKLIHPQSRHFCYAFILKPDGSHYRGSDDGEPSGTAGAPILGQIRSNELTNTLIVVARYFGGTKLGVSGLITAYKTAAAEALQNASIIDKTIDDYFHVRFTYEQTGDVMRILGNEVVNIREQTFEMDCLVEFSIRKTKTKMITDQLNKISTLEVKFIKTE